MADLNDLTRIKEQVDRLQREADKASGALEHAMVQLKEDFGCKTLEEGQKLLDELTQESKKAEDEFNKALKKFEDEWGDTL